MVEQKKSSRQSRSSAPVLVVTRSGNISNQVRMALKTVGYGKLTAVSSHVAGIERIRARSYDYVIFDARDSDMPAEDFVKQIVELDESSILLAISENPSIDDVFGLLKAGARGFLIHPFTTEALEGALDRANEGPPFSEAVLQAPDRNTALAGVVLNNLYRVSVLMRQAREFPSAAGEIERFKYGFTEAVELARMFCSDGDDELLRDKICEDCLLRAELAASRLGRTRIKLKKKRKTGSTDDEGEE